MSNQGSTSRWGAWASSSGSKNKASKAAAAAAAAAASAPPQGQPQMDPSPPPIPPSPSSGQQLQQQQPQAAPVAPSPGSGSGAPRASSNNGFWAPRKLSVVPYSPELSSQAQAMQLASPSASPAPQPQPPTGAAAVPGSAPAAQPSPSAAPPYRPPRIPGAVPASPVPGPGQRGSPVVSRPSFLRRVTSDEDDFAPGSGFGRAAPRDDIDGLPLTQSGGDFGSVRSIFDGIGSAAAPSGSAAWANGSPALHRTLDEHAPHSSAGRPTLNPLTFSPPGSAHIPAPSSSSAFSAGAHAPSSASASTPSRIPSGGSRNDIFSVPSPVVLPAPRLPPVQTPRHASVSNGAPSPTPSASSSSWAAFMSSPTLGGGAALPHASGASRSAIAQSGSSGSIHNANGAPAWHAPPPTLSLDSAVQSASAPPSAAPAAALAAPAGGSRRSNSSFYDASPVVAPPPRRSTIGQADGANGSGAPYAPGHARKPSTGRRTNEQRAQERARISRRSEESVEFRLRPTREYFLGEGRHCSVYLGAYRRRRHGAGSGSSDASAAAPATSAAQAAGGGRDVDPASDATVSSPVSSESFALSHFTSEFGWKLCAIKRLHADKTAQLVGLDEAYALRRLGNHPGIVKLIDLRDEVEAATTAVAAAASLAGAGRADADAHAADAIEEVPSEQNSAAGTPQLEKSGSCIETPAMRKKASMGMLGVGVPSAFATGSKAQDAPAPPADSPVGAVAHRRLASQPFEVRVDPAAQSSSNGYELPSWSSHPNGISAAGSDPPSHAPGGADAVPDSPARATAARLAKHDTPRLLILLELMPHSLHSFARKHPDYIDVQQWLHWARQLADVLAWMHEKGAVHADIKKENILLTEDLQVKLCDFNSTLWIDPNAPPTDGAGLGTPAYGAPELTRAISGGMPFGYEVDVWSLGAVLYSLASGVEPFARAASMVDILHRKRRFFESEESERVRRMNVTEGYGSTGSAPASRKSSLRGRKSVTTHSSSMHRREGSADSLDSVASNLTSMSTRAPTALAITMLLGDDETYHSVDIRPHHDPQAMPDAESSLSRATSIHAPGSLRGASASNHLSLPFPNPMRRTASFQNAPPEQQLRDSSSPRASLEDPNGRGVYGRPGGRERSSGSISSVNSAAASQLYQSVAAAMERAAKRKSTQDESFQHAYAVEPALTKAEHAELYRHYADGAPAMILPGGGRLPDAARDLLARMLLADPKARPSAKEVKAALDRIHA